MNKLIIVLDYYILILNFIAIFSDFYKLKNKKILEESKSSYISVIMIMFSLGTLFGIYSFKYMSERYNHHVLLGWMILFAIVGLIIMTVIILTNLYTIRKDVKNANKLNRINGGRK